MKILILAAGYGTRLYPLVKDTPKSLLPIHGRPLIDFILDKVSGLDGLEQIIVVTNNKFFSHFQKWAQDKKTSKNKILVINDRTTSPDDRLGSIGDIGFVLKEIQVNDDLLVIGGDNLFNYNVDEFIKFARTKKSKPTIGLFDIHDKEEAKKFGVVDLDVQKRVVSFEEKPPLPRSSLISMCFYYFPKSSLELIDEYIRSGNKADKAGEYIRWLTAKGDVYGFKFEGKWYDIGSIESYREAERDFKV